MDKSTTIIGSFDTLLLTIARKSNRKFSKNIEDLNNINQLLDILEYYNLNYHNTHFLEVHVKCLQHRR